MILLRTTVVEEVFYSLISGILRVPGVLPLLARQSLYSTSDNMPFDLQGTQRVMLGKGSSLHSKLLQNEFRFTRRAYRTIEKHIQFLRTGRRATLLDKKELSENHDS